MGIAFVFVHFLHAAGVYFSYKDSRQTRWVFWNDNGRVHGRATDADEKWNRSLFVFLSKCYIGQLTASSIVISSMGFEHQRIIGWGLSLLMLGGIMLDKSVTRPSLKYIMSLYTVKLVYAFSVDHDHTYRVSQ